MKMILEQLPEVEGKTGWPWTEEVSPEIYSRNFGWPKISIVTPSYNQGHFIEETIRSILLQNYPNLEYIIIDGGSTDNTVEIIKKYEPWISFWVSEPDKGQSDAINKGIAKCSGEVFNWLNSDDYYNKETFYKVARYFADNNVHLLSGRENVLRSTGLSVSFGTVIRSTAEESIKDLLFAQPSTFFKLELLKEFNGISSTLHYLMDAEFWLKYLLKYGQNRVLKVQDIFTVFRIHEESKTGSVFFNFYLEKCFLHYKVLQQLDVSEKVLQMLFNDKMLKTYSSKRDLFHIDLATICNKEYLRNILFEKYLLQIDLYKNYKRVKAILKVLPFSFIKSSKSLFRLYLKVNIIPSGIYDLYRSVRPIKIKDYGA